MIYYYDVILTFYKNKEIIRKKYCVSFCELIDFLVFEKSKSSSMEIYSIIPHFHYSRGVKYV